MKTNNDFSAHSAKGLGAVVAHASQRGNQRNVTLGSVTYLRAAMMLLMMLLTTATAWAEDVPAVYALTFDGNGGTCGDGQMNDQTFTYDESQNLTANAFSRTDYTFAGWNTKADGNGTSYKNGESVKNLTYTDGGTVKLYAQWTPTNYTITYYLNGGSVATANPTSYNIETPTFRLNNPTKENYHFVGWTKGNNNTLLPTVNITKGSTGNLDFTAHYNTNIFTVGDLSYQWISGIDVKVTACNSSATSVTIPATVTNEDVTYSVNAIDATAFSSCVSLNTVFLYSVNPPTLGSNVFDGCTALDAIYVPAGTEETYKAADGWKAYADKILAIDTGTYGADVYYSYDSSTKTLRIFGTGAMEDHNIPWDNYRADITKVVISDGVTSIGEQAFFGCSSLTSITIPASVTTIGMYAFYGCNSLTSIEIPSGVTSIGINPFYGCSGLESISVASGNTKYDSRDKCNAIIETETNRLITGCKNSFIPYDVTSIGQSAFNGCTGLTSIEIPSGVTTIGIWVFENCTSLKSIEIPASVTSIGINAFYGCSGLESISVAEGNPTYDSRNNCNALIETKTNTLILGCKNTVIPGNPNGVTSIGDNAFYGCTDLTSIKIPASVTTIGTQAFDGCTSLKSIEIPASVTSIGRYAFWACTGLESISVASGNAKYHSGGNCLIETESHTLILGCKNSVIPDDVTTIGDFAFYDCIGLTTIEIPASVTSIGDYAFQNCTSLTSIEIPASVTSIGDYAFDGCTSLTSIEIPANVTSIDGGAFRGCISLTSIEIPASVTSIGGGAFEDCTGLKSVTICAPQLGDHNEYSEAFVGNASGRKIYVFENCMDYYKAQAWSVDYPGMGFYEEDILPITDISLKDNDDNRSLIAAASGNSLKVKLEGRTLYKDGDWNTLCLPFNVTVGSGVMAGATAMTLNGSESGFDASTGVLTLNFVGVTSGNTIAAGTPFIVKWQKPDGYVAYNPATPEAECSDIVSPVFEGVTVSNAATTQTFGNGSFKGTYQSITFTDEDQSILFLGAGNTLYYPESGAKIGAQRAYFDLGTAQARQFVLRFVEDPLTEGGNFDGEGTQNGIGHTEITEITERAGAWYTIDGVRLDGKPTKKGLYIHGGKKVVVP